jgi:hypothetical protein
MTIFNGFYTKENSRTRNMTRHKEIATMCDLQSEWWVSWLFISRRFFSI